MLQLLSKAHFSKSSKPTSEFKSFFRLRLQDRPIRIASKVKETYKTNKSIRRFLHGSKYLFALGFLYFVFPGTFIPGQYHAKIILIESRRWFSIRLMMLTQAQGSGEDFVKVIQFLNWKFNYLRKNGMLSPSILASDLRELCQLIDDQSILGSANSKKSSSNQVIYECLSYIQVTFLPSLLKHNMPYFQNENLQNALVDLLDIISLRYERELDEIKGHDTEEFLYREAMMTQFANICIILLKYGRQHVQVYQLFEEIIRKTGDLFDVAESFTTMEGIQLLLTDLNASDSEDRQKMGLPVSADVEMLRAQSLHMLRVLIQTDELVAVKLFKLKILSNLLTYTMKGSTEKSKSEIKLIVEAFARNQYREQLVNYSQDFKDERKRLQACTTYDWIDQDVKKTLIQALSQ